MKKSISMMLILLLSVCLFGLTGCGEKAAEIENPYEGLNLEEYITLPDYNVYTTTEPVVEISDEDVDAEIQSRLEDAATTESVTEGTVEKGDTVKISYKGTLSDGSTQDGMNSDEYQLTLGAANMIDGFQEGIYGATIGEPVTLNLQFPDPYEVNEELSGQPVTFVVTVLSKEVEVTPQLDEEFVKANSDAKTVEEYREAVKKELEQLEYDKQLYDLKNEIFSKLSEETEVLQYPEERVNEVSAVLDTQYRSSAQQYGYEEWEVFLDEVFAMTQEEFDEQIRLAAQNQVKNEMITFAIAEKEDMVLTQDEYQKGLDDMLEAVGMDAETFQSYVGVTIEEYAKENNFGRDLLLTKELDAIYERLEKN